MDKKNLVIVEFNDRKETCQFKEKLKPGDFVVVSEPVGIFIGKVLKNLDAGKASSEIEILRIATQKDLTKNEENAKKAKKQIVKAKEIAGQFGLDLKITSAFYTLDADKLLFTFVSENRVDFRDFVKQLAATFKTRIELKQIGSRDEVKCCGGLGVCGKMCCCKEFLPEFAKVSIKMAKNQNLSLNPQKINGLCGRLMCCLAFENENYASVMKRMPKLGSEVGTPQGNGIATYDDVLGEKVSVKFTDDNGGFEIKDFPLKDVKVKTYAIKE